MFNQRPRTARHVTAPMLCLVVLAVGPACHAQALPERIAAAESLDERRELATAFVERSVVGRISAPGFAAAVAVDGELVWSRAWGLADVERRELATSRTRFGIGSVSKILTTAAIARLHEAGKLDLDRPIQAYVPEFPDKGDPISVRMLAAHLGGIRHYNPGEPEAVGHGGRHFSDVAGGLALFKDDPLVAPPGTSWQYSSYGWTLISAAIEAAAGQAYLEYMTEQIFRPLDMTRTVADDVRRTIPDRATGYEGHGDQVKPSRTYDKSFVWAAGGFLSTPEDLVRFGTAFTAQDDGFFEPETLETVFTPQRTSAGKAVPFGIGWMVDRTGAGTRVAYHGGTTSGGGAMLLVRPDQGVVVAFAGNHESGAGEDEANAIASIFTGTPDDLELAGAMERRGRKKALRARLRAMFDALTDDLAAGDLEGVMSVVSTEFSSRTFSDRSSLQDGLRRAFATAPLATDDSNAHARFTGNEVNSLAILSGLGVEGGIVARQETTVTFRLEDVGWRLYGWDVVIPAP